MTSEAIPEISEKKGLKSELSELRQIVQTLLPKSKDSRWKLGFGKIKTRKPDQIGILKLQTNRTAWFTKAPVSNGFIDIDGKKKNADHGFVFLLDGKHPFMVVPEWKINPLPTEQEEIRLGDNAYAEQVFIRALEQIQAEDGKKKMSVNMWIWIGIGAVILGYVLFAGQGK